MGDCFLYRISRTLNIIKNSYSTVAISWLVCVYHGLTKNMVSVIMVMVSFYRFVLKTREYFK